MRNYQTILYGMKKNRKELTILNNNDKNPFTFFVAYDGVSVSASASWLNNDNDNNSNSKFYLP